MVTFSFQKALGGEAGIGVAALSPRAVARLDGYEPPRAVPKVLRLTRRQGCSTGRWPPGTMINTFSVWTLEDWIDALDWAQGAGGLAELDPADGRQCGGAGRLGSSGRTGSTTWPRMPAIRSTTSVCLKIVDPRVTALDDKGRQAFVKRMKTLLEDEGAAFDVESHRNAPAGPAHLVRLYRRDRRHRGGDAVAGLGVRDGCRGTLSRIRPARDDIAQFPRYRLRPHSSGDVPWRT